VEQWKLAALAATVGKANQTIRPLTGRTKYHAAILPPHPGVGRSSDGKPTGSTVGYFLGRCAVGETGGALRSIVPPASGAGIGGRRWL